MFGLEPHLLSLCLPLLLLVLSFFFFLFSFLLFFFSSFLLFFFFSLLLFSSIFIEIVAVSEDPMLGPEPYLEAPSLYSRSSIYPLSFFLPFPLILFHLDLLFLQGEFVKHYGYVSTDAQSTPQAFSHFSYQESDCELLVLHHLPSFPLVYFLFSYFLMLC